MDVWVDVCTATQQGEAQPAQLPTQGDEGSSPSPAALSQAPVVRLPQRSAPPLHGGFEQQPPGALQVGLELLLDILRQRPAGLTAHRAERRIVLLDGPGYNMASTRISLGIRVSTSAVATLLEFVIDKTLALRC